MFQVGQSLGDYAILQELGRGGYGQVYKVEHTITGRREAMKVLAAGNSDATEQADRFLREIRLQSSLNHPNIALVHTAFWVNDDLALVCELLEGRSLQRLLEDEGPIPQGRAIDIVTQVLDALSYAHARGIIHRDISPGNIFLTDSGTVKIIDFGLAKAATDLRLTREGAPVGAAHYMSPEQIRGAREIDARTDVYSCGVVLYELLAGKKPFDGEDAFTIMKAHTEQAPEPPIGVNSHVSKELSAIVLRALGKKPEERFQSSDAFLQAIKNVALVPIKTAAVKPRRLLNRPVFIAACAALTILIGFLLAAVATRVSSAQSRNTKSFVVPPPPAPAAVVIPPPAVVTPAVEATPPVPVVAKTAATVPAKPKPRKPAPPTKPVASAALVEPSETPVSAPPDVKAPNRVVKVLKKINPFQPKN